MVASLVLCTYFDLTKYEHGYVPSPIANASARRSYQADCKNIKTTVRFELATLNYQLSVLPDYYYIACSYVLFDLLGKSTS